MSQSAALDGASRRLFLRNSGTASCRAAVALLADRKPSPNQDSGHGAHFQFPEEFAEAAARFLAAA